MTYTKCYINVTLNVTKLIENVSKPTITLKMVRTKTNFKPSKTPSSGFGDTLNDNSLIDGVVLMSAMSDKVTLDAVRKMDKLEQQTPFDAETIPESIVE